MGPQGPCWRGAYCFPSTRKPITTMQHSSLPQEAKPTSKAWRYLKRTAIGIAALFVIIIVAAIVDSSNDPKQPAEQGNAPVQTENHAQSPVETFNIEVTNQIVKKVDGKYRYFFDIRNKDTKDFNGSVTIQLITAEGQKISSETFNTTKPIVPGLGTSQYIEARTGPVAIHGSSGYAKYTYEVKIDSGTVKAGEGSITDQYEDLSN